MALEVCGFAVHATALQRGPLAAVQLILGCSLVVSVVVSGWLSRRALRRRSWSAMLVVVAVGASVTLLRPDLVAGFQIGSITAPLIPSLVS